MLQQCWLMNRADCGAILLGALGDCCALLPADAPVMGLKGITGAAMALASNDIQFLESASPWLEPGLAVPVDTPRTRGIGSGAISRGASPAAPPAPPGGRRESSLRQSADRMMIGVSMSSPSKSCRALRDDAAHLRLDPGLHPPRADRGARGTPITSGSGSGSDRGTTAPGATAGFDPFAGPGDIFARLLVI